MQFSYGRAIFKDNYTVGGDSSNPDVFTTEVFKQNRTDAKFPKGRTIFSRSWLARPVTVTAPGFNSGLRYTKNRQGTKLRQKVTQRCWYPATRRHGVMTEDVTMCCLFKAIAQVFTTNLTGSYPGLNTGPCSGKPGVTASATSRPFISLFSSA
jgi:hypothetical protein